jgi:glycosyltransferase involved in cell wall biosynthesis
VLGPAYPALLVDGPELMARTIDCLLENAAARGALGDQNRARAEKLFDAARMVDGVEAIYRAVLEPS